MVSYLTVFIAFLMYTRSKWCASFKDRPQKGSLDCPSSRAMPRLLSSQKLHETNLKQKSLKFASIDLKPTTNDAVDADGQRVDDKVNFLRNLHKPSKWKSKIHEENDNSRLHMDHMHLPFYEFAKGVFLLLPNLLACTIVGLVSLFCRYHLRKLVPFLFKKGDPQRLLCDMLLETALCIYCTEAKREGIKATGVFRITKLAILLNDGGDPVIRDELLITIDLIHRKLVSAVLDGKTISAKDALVIVVFYSGVQHHVQIHSFSNWGIPSNDLMNKSDMKVILNSLSAATIVYNHFGFSGFPGLVPILKSIGVFQTEFNVTSCFLNGMNKLPPEHSNIVHLLPFSDFARFVLLLRPYFFHEFRRVRSHAFPGVTAEAYLVVRLILRILIQSIPSYVSCLHVGHRDSFS
jgi:hypothetical protein